MLYSAISTEHCANVRAIAMQLSGSDRMHEQQLVAYAKACVEQAYSYFQAKFDNDHKPTLLAFKAARYFSLLKVHKINPMDADLETLRAFPFLNSTQIIDCLKSELPKYTCGCL